MKKIKNPPDIMKKINKKPPIVITKIDKKNIECHEKDQQKIPRDVLKKI